MSDKTFKETEYYLYNHKNLNELNDITDTKIEALNNDVSLKAISYEEKSGPTNKFNSDVENEVIRREEKNEALIEALKKEKLKRNFIAKIVDNFLNTLDAEQKKIIELRYFAKPKQSWTQISLETNRSVAQCIRERSMLVEKLAKMINS